MSLIPLAACLIAVVVGCQPTPPLARAREETTFARIVSTQDGDAQSRVCRSELPLFVYSEVPPAKTPAVMAHEELAAIPVGSPLEEIKRAAELFCLNQAFMIAVAKIESDFNPKNRTGKYIGLFQLSQEEFRHYGCGSITDPRDNAIAAAWKFVNEGFLFENDTRKQPSPSDLYLIHQQGWQGAAEHVSHPDRLAWKSMCATDEGKERGEKWCKRAIWENTLPAVKRQYKSVDNLTSGEFVTMWRDRVNQLYAQYNRSQTANGNPNPLNAYGYY
jgi:hypothetical protein